MSQGSSKADFEAAAGRMREGCIDVTPLRKSHWLSEELGGDVYLKLECLHQAGSFKQRGVTNYLLACREARGAFPARVMTASGGNHGLAVACACQRLSIPCIVVLPTNSVTEAKVRSLERFGATVEVHGDVWDDANAHVLAEVARDASSEYIHPFAHGWIRQGTGTIFLELQAQLTALEGPGAAPADVVMASVGGGGLLSGMMACAAALGSQVDFACVETEGTAWLYQSMAKGELVCLSKVDSIASTLGAKTTSPDVWEVVRNVTYPMQVSDAEAVEAIWQILAEEKLLVEPATSVNVAALLKHKEKFKGKKIVVVICGTGLTLSQACEWKEKFCPDK
mmetsp:Transcript_1804/g.6450  ORF Transcript_1804/g.6450 Transcript_1804/m.6450 type:complete len:338 (+) Transcript_1804:122-1135(+)|eukprot:CAMPEP_0114615916 /NCGR_PEP_ID=MMETSP0168-20121206/6417_1 /TAXON_ID=95228 ORGANISM="Vannella sp., Strain DIVA3 517/6/12" /NCGR_SAMPLE_ID=MMETSP0168 /ASSEMBLY_ACC=CAM_ASM_000044 /LENGTH=337 /DNA_ID=CAMNT_0001827013 /DNA_START=78 /DNA_END=1091 /DNA_ORIENTATION=-